MDYFSALLSVITHELARIPSWNDLHWADLSTTGATSFALIVAAEMGDKSQLVCMTLATKHKPLPVLVGAIAAFALLNTLAVVFGVAIASWLPDYLVAGSVALLFAVFGIQALLTGVDDEETLNEKSGHGIFFTTFLLITVAEFGDKTQLAVVALSSASLPLGVWLGATGALVTTSALGVLLGRTLQHLPQLVQRLHKISGLIFLTLSILAGFRAYWAYTGITPSF